MKDLLSQSVLHFRLGTSVLAALLLAGGACLSPAPVFSAPAAQTAAAPADRAKSAFARGSYEDALRLATPLAQQGNAEAMVVLGKLYANGVAVDQDPVTAREWFEKAAEKGDVEGMLELAGAYRTGFGAPKNPVRAFELTQQAADKGSADGQYSLAVMLLAGKIVEKNPKLAYAWAMEAAGKGHGPAMALAGTLLSKGIGTDRDEARGEELLRKARERGYESEMIFQ